MNLTETAAEPYAAVVAMDKALRAGPLNTTLQELVKLRASLLNGCAYCISQHTRAARAVGADDDRIVQLDDWPHSAVFTDAERAAFSYTDKVTRLDTVSDDLWDTLKRHFTDDELGHLVMHVAMINAFNRIAIPLHMHPPDHSPSHR